MHLYLFFCISSSLDCFGSSELNSSTLHTKNHSSSFSAKKKRKKSVITFNFDTAQTDSFFSPYFLESLFHKEIFDPECKNQNKLSVSVRSSTDSLLFFFTTYVFQRRCDSVQCVWFRISRGWRNGISQVGETCFQQKFKQTKRKKKLHAKLTKTTQPSVFSVQAEFYSSTGLIFFKFHTELL